MFPERKFNITMGNSKCKRKFRFFIFFFRAFFIQTWHDFCPKKNPSCCTIRRGIPSVRKGGDHDHQAEPSGQREEDAADASGDNLYLVL